MRGQGTVDLPRRQPRLVGLDLEFQAPQHLRGHHLVHQQDHPLRQARLQSLAGQPRDHPEVESGSASPLGVQVKRHRGRRLEAEKQGFVVPDQLDAGLQMAHDAQVAIPVSQARGGEVQEIIRMAVSGIVEKVPRVVAGAPAEGGDPGPDRRRR